MKGQSLIVCHLVWWGASHEYYYIAQYGMLKARISLKMRPYKLEHYYNGGIPQFDTRGREGGREPTSITKAWLVITD